MATSLPTEVRTSVRHHAISSAKDYKRQREKKVIFDLPHPVPRGKSNTTTLVVTRDKTAIHHWEFCKDPHVNGACLERYQRFDAVGPQWFDFHILAEDIVFEDPVPALFAEPRVPDEALEKAIRILM